MKLSKKERILMQFLALGPMELRTLEHRMRMYGYTEDTTHDVLVSLLGYRLVEFTLDKMYQMSPGAITKLSSWGDAMGRVLESSKKIKKIAPKR